MYFYKVTLNWKKKKKQEVVAVVSVLQFAPWKHKKKCRFRRMTTEIHLKE